MFSFGKTNQRINSFFTGSMNSSSKLSWDDVDINRDNYRSISPRTRLYGVGSYDADSMMNLAASRSSNERIGSYGHQYANGGAMVTSATQISALGTRPSAFWDARRMDYASDSAAGDFTSQNNNHFYSLWRLSDGTDIITDIAGGNNGAPVLLNLGVDWDDQLFAINGQGKGNTTNGTHLSKVVLPAAFTDFSATRPLLMSMSGGLPRGGGDIVSKDEPGDAYWRAGDFDYYLNYYSKYDGTSKKLLAKDDGMDWYGLYLRPQIDGTQPVATLAATAPSALTGYSRVVKNIIYMKLIL